MRDEAMSSVLGGNKMMVRFLVIGVLAVSAFGQVPSPASSDSSPLALRFQVATIKPSRPDETRTMLIRGNRYSTTNTTLVDLLKYAYGLHEREIVGGPKWLETQKFDIVGDPETQTRPSSDGFKRMVQNLLADRFHLAAHHETRELSVFAIVQSKGGPRLIASTGPPNAIPTVGYSEGALGARNATMGDLATFLQRFVADRPVVDETGLAGKYDVTLRWTPDDSQAEGIRQSDGISNTFPGLYTAIEEQLGLKLREERRPAQVFVIDRVEMPSEN
jgi:uncharacterized protein (TIGR03435 family)